MERTPPRSGSICTSAASTCSQKQLSSVSLLPCSLKGLRKLAELLPPLRTHGLEFIVTTVQESGLLLALRMVLDPCTTPGQTSRLAQPPPLRRASGLALPRSRTGTAGPWAEQPLALAPLGHPDECGGQLLAECPTPCPGPARLWLGGGSQALGMAWQPWSLLLCVPASSHLHSSSGRCPVVGVAAEKPRCWETRARCCCWEGSMESGSVPACAVVTSAVFVIP